jgi:UDP-N-acetylglucosamine--N-acetylmuramyl-(pentapeptide) pyrophosphoryl-undecaprenol N-acetylglucosamine transferase
VLGGSLGSAAVNKLIAAALPRLCEKAFVVHQMGERDFRPSDRPGYFAAPFFGSELPHLMAAADLVVSRSGANSLAELAALGKPSILIPLPQGGMSRGDQIRNAGLFRDRGAALVLAQEEATGERLAELATGLLADPESLARMGRNARSLSAGDPAAEIARQVLARLGPGAG